MCIRDRGWVINKTAVRNRGILLAVVCGIAMACFAMQFRMPFNVALVALFAAVYSGVTQFNMPIAFAMVPDALKRPELLDVYKRQCKRC